MNITHTLSLPALTVTLMLFISGCQITNNKLASNISYGEYYLTLQQLTEIQLMEEVNKLQANISTISAQPSTPDYDSQIKLLLYTAYLNHLFIIVSMQKHCLIK